MKATKHFHDVRQQRGRAQLDADWNEWVALLGGSGGPKGTAGFKLVLDNGALAVTGGHYYVDGRLCNAERGAYLRDQPHAPLGTPIVTVKKGLDVTLDGATRGHYFAYLDVWAQPVAAFDHPAIGEAPLLGPDTATRAKNAWQVRLVRAAPANKPIRCLSNVPAWTQVTAASTGKLAARTAGRRTPLARRRGAARPGPARAEKRLYRVEVHASGENGTAMFKWSRDNGTVASRVDLTIPASGSGFVLLEDGIEVRFGAGTYRAGDYWVIPARTSPPAVYWPTTSRRTPIARPPHGIEHYYCRLAILRFDGVAWKVLGDCRKMLPIHSENA